MRVDTSSAKHNFEIRLILWIFLSDFKFFFNLKMIFKVFILIVLATAVLSRPQGQVGLLNLNSNDWLLSSEFNLIGI